MSFSTLIFALFVGLSVAGYTLEDDYVSGGNFFDMFTFFTAADPTDGFVQYVDQSTASSNGYINSTTSSVYIGTDYTNVASSSGRESVRITSNNAYDSGLIILDLAHMPGGICGTWPAFWTVGPNWPNGGEIDIIEGVNAQTTNDMTLHTSEGCEVTNDGDFTGTLSTSDCWVDDPNQSDNAGCGIDSTSTQTYGAGFNSIDGGVYATEFTSSLITIWFFPRGSIPSDITSGSPDPSGWSEPQAQFNGCDISEFFTNQQIVFDLTFCGSWAGAVWSSGSCASEASSCDSYVQNNPSAFKNAYWEINSLKVYQESSTNNEATSTTTTASSSAATTTLATSTSIQASTSSAIPTSIVASTSSSVVVASSSSTPAVSSPSSSLVMTGTSLPISPNSTASYTSSNSSIAGYPTGTAGSASSAGSSSTVPYFTAPTVTAASAPISSSAVVTSSSTVDESTVASTTFDGFPYTRHFHNRQHGYETPVAAKRHLGEHKRNARGRRS